MKIAIMVIDRKEQKIQLTMGLSEMKLYRK